LSTSKIKYENEFEYNIVGVAYQMSHPIEYYIRGLEPAVQSALLTRMRALVEPDEDTAFELFEAAKKYLYGVAKDSAVARYLINCASSDLGWGDYRRDHAYGDAYKPRQSFVRSNPIHENAKLAYNELQNGNPLPIDVMTCMIKVPSDAVNVLFRLGFSNAVYELAEHGFELKNLRTHCRGLNLKVLVVCANQTLENLVYVFGLLRRRCPELVMMFYYEMSGLQNHHIDISGNSDDIVCPYYDLSLIHI
jgi:hypothetical protein